MGTFTPASKNIMLDALSVGALSLHSADPGVDGTANELTGGSPAYARKAAVYAAAANGERVLSADVLFDVPPGAVVAYVGKWSTTTGTFRGADQVTSESYVNQGQHKVLANSSKLFLADPV